MEELELNEKMTTISSAFGDGITFLKMKIFIESIDQDNPNAEEFFKALDIIYKTSKIHLT